MTASFETITEFVFKGKAAKAEERATAHEELEKMSKAMVEEKGLLNHAQAAVVLGVSVKRVWELVRFGKLRRFDFAGRTYVSWSEVNKRYVDEIAAGRRLSSSVPARLAAGVSAAIKTDAAQWKLGGFAGAYGKVKEEERAKRIQEDKAKKRTSRGEFVKKLLDPMEPPKKKGKK